MITRIQQARRWAAHRLAGRTKVQSSLYYASSSILCQILRFVTVIVSTRLIGANEFGLFAQGTLALAFASLGRDVGQNFAFASYVGTDRRYAVFNFQINLVFGTVSSLILWSVLQLVPGVPAALRPVAGLLAAINFCETLTLTVAVMAQREFRFRLVAVGEISAVTVYLAAIIALIYHLEGFLVLLWAQFIEGIVRLLMVGTGLRWQFVGWTGGGDLKHYYFRHKTFFWILQNLLQTVSSRIDFILLSSFAGVSVLGVYERVSQFVRIPMSLSINAIDRVLAASYSKEQNSPGTLRETLRKARGLVLLAAMGAAGVATLGIVLVLDRLIGADWTATIRHYWWMALPFSIIVPQVFNNTILLQNTGRPKHLVLFTLCTAGGELVLGGTALWLGTGVGGMFVARTVVWLGVFALQFFLIRSLLERMTAASPMEGGEAPQRVNSNMPQA